MEQQTGPPKKNICKCGSQCLHLAHLQSLKEKEMAINRGVLGTQTGSMGGITASNWKGKNVYKQKVPANNNSNSPAQQVQRQKFAALAKYARLLGPAVRIGFKQEAVSVTEQNVFTSKNFDAVSMVGGVATVDLAALQVSSGTVGGIVITAADLAEGTSTVTVTYLNNSNGLDALITDQVIGIVVNSFGTILGVNIGLADRGELSMAIELSGPVALAPGVLYVYMFAKRANSTATSPSTARRVITNG